MKMTARRMRSDLDRRIVTANRQFHSTYVVRASAVAKVSARVYQNNTRISDVVCVVVLRARSQFAQVSNGALYMLAVM
jgi:hypothetical protein